MISDHSTTVPKNLTNVILPKSLSCHIMKEFSIFIPKLDKYLSESLLPIYFLHVQQIQDVTFDIFPENSLLRL